MIWYHTSAACLPGTLPAHVGGAYGAKCSRICLAQMELQVRKATAKIAIGLKCLVCEAWGPSPKRLRCLALTGVAKVGHFQFGSAFSVGCRLLQLASATDHYGWHRPGRWLHATLGFQSMSPFIFGDGTILHGGWLGKGKWSELHYGIPSVWFNAQMTVPPGTPFFPELGKHVRRRPT